MLIATVFSLAYSLRFISKVFLGRAQGEAEVDVHAAHGAAHDSHGAAPAEEAEHGRKIVDIPNYMKVALAILVVLVVIIGIYPSFFMQLIQTVAFGGI
jgi:NADH:ubiquinone oxidoreductase subunit 5 (subunit L)/multisubunit Na+/H+ antiporter MnhA subunit